MNERVEKLKKIVIHSLKIGLGSCIAILTAEALNLPFASTAGIIVLLSTVATKWGTVKISILRFVTYIITVAACFFLYHFIRSDWIAFGIFMFFIFGLCSLLNWKDTVSVNAVVGTHFLASTNFMSSDFSLVLTAVFNEFLLVAIGVGVALFLNLFNDYKSQKKRIIFDMQYIEIAIQDILAEIAGYLLNESMGNFAWDNLKSLEKYLDGALRRAREYQDNTFVSHPGYYIEYAVMRFKQCNILLNLYDELKKIKQMPAQAKIVAGYITYLKEYVREHNIPEKQFAELSRIFDTMKQEPLPKNWENFDSMAILYHILMAMEDFLHHKQRFINSLNEKQLAIYWKEA